MVKQCTKRSASAYGDRGFTHAADHRLKIMGPSGSDDTQSFADTATLHQLEIDTVNTPSQARCILRKITGFVNVYRQSPSGEKCGQLIVGLMM
jgi:hypothetical protein